MSVQKPHLVKTLSFFSMQGYLYIITSTLQIGLLQLFFFFSFLPLSRVLYVVYVSVENYVLCTRLK